MGRIRTVKPALFKHEELFDAEQETGLPLRLAFIGLFTQCDREGRFGWHPRQLKSDILPYDEVDFSRVLDALLTRGFVVKYGVGGEVFGHIPSWHKHQVPNNRETRSIIPEPTDDNRLSDASSTRAPRLHVTPSGEREQEREQEREDKKEHQQASPANGDADDFSSQASYWALAPELKAKGITRSMMGKLANVLAGDFDAGICALHAARDAKDPVRYLGAVIRERNKPPPSQDEEADADAGIFNGAYHDSIEGWIDVKTGKSVPRPNSPLLPRDPCEGF